MKKMLEACDALGPDDGVDPRTVAHASRRGPTNRKTLQLCSEIARTLRWVLAWESGDEVLSSLDVSSVVPTPNCGRLLVTVYQATPDATLQPAQIIERLSQVAGKLRAEVAAAIHRRRVPELVYRVLLP